MRSHAIFCIIQPGQKKKTLFTKEGRESESPLPSPASYPPMLTFLVHAISRIRLVRLDGRHGSAHDAGWTSQNTECRRWDL
jgi:hypothetical protein